MANVAVIKNDYLADVIVKKASDLDFERLDNLIDKIATCEMITDSMREQANDFANTWNNLITAKIREKEYAYNDFLNFFDEHHSRDEKAKYLYETDDRCYRCYGNSNVSLRDMVLAILNSDEKFSKQKELFDKLDTEYQTYRAKVDEIEDSRIDVEEDTMSYTDFVLAHEKMDLHVRTLRHETNVMYRKINEKTIGLIRDIKNMTSDYFISIRREKRNLSNMKKTVEEKTALMKMSISFGGTDLLKVLREIHDFQKEF